MILDSSSIELHQLESWCSLIDKFSDQEVITILQTHIATYMTNKSDLFAIMHEKDNAFNTVWNPLYWIS